MMCCRWKKRIKFIIQKQYLANKLTLDDDDMNSANGK